MSPQLRELGSGMAISLVLAGTLAAAVARWHLSADLLSVTCWVLVTAGVAGTFLAGRGNAWGWLLLVMLQPLWVVYAVVTDQHGFVIGALASGGAQVTGYLRTFVRRHPGVPCRSASTLEVCSAILRHSPVATPAGTPHRDFVSPPPSFATIR
jgi:hypothetical protein